jgi:hypothetical protein
MQVVLLRVGIDTGSGGIHGPLFRNQSFEFLWIPDKYNVEKRTYGSLIGRYGRSLIEYFPPNKQEKMQNWPVHADPEFDTFTYGDPTKPKAGLRHLQSGDFLAFYCGLEGWGWECPPALYLIGYFHVLMAGLASTFTEYEVTRHFSANAHVRHRDLYLEQRDRLVLVKGAADSRLLQKAVKISEVGYDISGRQIPLLSQEMRGIFGDLRGKGSIMRSPPRRIKPEFANRAATFLVSCD